MRITPTFLWKPLQDTCQQARPVPDDADLAGVADHVGERHGPGANLVGTSAAAQSVMKDGRTEGAQDLIVAIFRLAVADYMGLSYGHDGPGRSRSIRPPFRSEAAAFLASESATRLADLIGLSADAIWSQARRLRGNQVCGNRCTVSVESHKIAATCLCVPTSPVPTSSPMTAAPQGDAVSKRHSPEVSSNHPLCNAVIWLRRTASQVRPTSRTQGRNASVKQDQDGGGEFVGSSSIFARHGGPDPQCQVFSRPKPR